MTPKTAPLVSVVMPVYNGEKYIAEAIQSILTQTYRHLELLIVDDGSRDGSAEMIRNFAERDERVRFLRHEANRGIADARNTAIAAAKGQYIANMDCDDVSLPDRLEKQLRFLDANPEISGVGACCRYVDRDLSHLRDGLVPQQHALIVFHHFLSVPLYGNTLILRQEVMNALGGYQPGRRFAEETEFEGRLLLGGRYKFANLPDTLLLYRQHQQPRFSQTDIKKNDLGARREVKRRGLKNLNGEAPPEETIDLFERLLPYRKLNWRERRLAKRDIIRLIDAMIERNLIEPGDKPQLIAEMNRLLERASPRLWQMFCHWRQHHFRRRSSPLRSEN